MTSLVPTPSTEVAAALLDDLRDARRGAAALPALQPDSYARDHAAFERRSDQRGLIADHLAGRLAELGDGPLSVLSVGCGDGTLDVRLAEGLVRAVPGRPVRYVGIEPWSGSAGLFTAEMAALGARELSAEVQVASFADAVVDETFDAVVFVHSIYYVADLELTLRKALALVRPGGQLWVLNAPRAALNALVDVLAPPLDDHRQWFSSDVAEAFHATGIVLDEISTLDALVELAPAGDDVLDFAVQARLTPELRRPVRAYLDAVSVPGADGEPHVPHPVDVFVATRL
ncbi:class I SAM-dependent methyltransferase [Williamsia herbipolensis]|uniref:Class I SAM-dependent methyltransferase n=1 Tax=Williamsia herbipolensis TaxID=1603258 RepID=A0AAU4K3Z5_9NOCA|nr:methyltransferase domain-containing protein [Williamsia herbipolensis]